MKKKTSARAIKVVVVVGTRPEIIRLSRVIAVLKKHMDVVLVHTGQNYDYELNEIFFKDLELAKPDYFLKAAGLSAADTIGKVIARVDPVLAKEKPDALLVLGDTNSCMCAIPAKRRKIPIFHMEAGNRCFDQRVPEEINRKIVDHLSDINMPYSDIARSYLIQENFPADRIIKTGSPLNEVLHYYADKIDRAHILSRLGCKAGEYFVVSAHREENVDDPKRLKMFVDILNDLYRVYGKKVIVSTHPRTRLRLKQARLKTGRGIELLKPLGFCDYVHLQKKAYAVLSDSGTITEEASILNIPALNIRDAHERPEGMEEASVMMTGLSCERIHQALQILKSQEKENSRMFRLVQDYDAPHVADKVVRIIASYIDYVNRRVWQK